uniref:uncharacterized protein LOC120334395 n=1 Tax=Styela clava TaxID=7725 RepID=UPI00193A4A13|nr:uncharacterized protein LOC120334395 [Styela clava]
MSELFVSFLVPDERCSCALRKLIELKNSENILERPDPDPDYSKRRKPGIQNRLCTGIRVVVRTTFRHDFSVRYNSVADPIHYYQKGNSNFNNSNCFILSRKGSEKEKKESKLNESDMEERKGRGDKENSTHNTETRPRTWNVDYMERSARKYQGSCPERMETDHQKPSRDVEKTYHSRDKRKENKNLRSVLVNRSFAPSQLNGNGSYQVNIKLLVNENCFSSSKKDVAEKYGSEIKPKFRKIDSYQFKIKSHEETDDWKCMENHENDKRSNSKNKKIFVDEKFVTKFTRNNISSEESHFSFQVYCLNINSVVSMSQDSMEDCQERNISKWGLNKSLAGLEIQDFENCVMTEETKYENYQVQFDDSDIRSVCEFKKITGEFEGKLEEVCNQEMFTNDGEKFCGNSKYPSEIWQNRYHQALSSTNTVEHLNEERSVKQMRNSAKPVIVYRYQVKNHEDARNYENSTITVVGKKFSYQVAGVIEKKRGGYKPENMEMQKKVIRLNSGVDSRIFHNEAQFQPMSLGSITQRCFKNMIERILKNLEEGFSVKLPRFKPFTLLQNMTRNSMHEDMYLDVVKYLEIYQKKCEQLMLHSAIAEKCNLPEVTEALGKLISMFYERSNYNPFSNFNEERNQSFSEKLVFTEDYSRSIVSDGSYGSVAVQQKPKGVFVAFSYFTEITGCVIQPCLPSCLFTCESVMLTSPHPKILWKSHETTEVRSFCLMKSSLALNDLFKFWQSVDFLSSQSPHRGVCWKFVKTTQDKILGLYSTNLKATHNELLRSVSFLTSRPPHRRVSWEFGKTTQNESLILYSEKPNVIYLKKFFENPWESLFYSYEFTTENKIDFQLIQKILDKSNIQCCWFNNENILEDAETLYGWGDKRCVHEYTIDEIPAGIYLKTEAQLQLETAQPKAIENAESNVDFDSYSILKYWEDALKVRKDATTSLGEALKVIEDASKSLEDIWKMREDAVKSLEYSLNSVLLFQQELINDVYNNYWIKSAHAKTQRILDYEFIFHVNHFTNFFYNFFLLFSNQTKYVKYYNLVVSSTEQAFQFDHTEICRRNSSGIENSLFRLNCKLCEKKYVEKNQGKSVKFVTLFTNVRSSHYQTTILLDSFLQELRNAYLKPDCQAFIILDGLDQAEPLFTHLHNQVPDLTWKKQQRRTLIVSRKQQVNRQSSTGIKICSESLKYNQGLETNNNEHQILKDEEKTENISESDTKKIGQAQTSPEIGKLESPVLEPTLEGSKTVIQEVFVRNKTIGEETDSKVCSFDQSALPQSDFVRDDFITDKNNPCSSCECETEHKPRSIHGKPLSDSHWQHEDYQLSDNEKSCIAEHNPGSIHGKPASDSQLQHEDYPLPDTEKSRSTDLKKESDDSKKYEFKAQFDSQEFSFKEALDKTLMFEDFNDGLKKSQDYSLLIENIALETTKETIQDEPEILNYLPPAGNFQTHESRLRSFQFNKDFYFNSEHFARAGFYAIQSQHVNCYSCGITLQITEQLARSVFERKWHQSDCQHIRKICHTIQPANQKKQLVAVEADGTISDDVRDPPGQQSIYIPPGDVRREAYRLSTYEHYPVSSPISRKSLAKAGFYYTGFFDRVKCFSCARTVERWNDIDSPTDIRWHKSDCLFARNHDSGNIPIRSLFERSSNQAGPSRNQEEVLQQRDATGEVVRTVRYPADLPERVRQTGGTFEIGPNNTIRIQTGPGQNTGNVGGLGSQPPQPRRWRMANVISSDHRRFLTNLHLNRELDRLASFARWPVGRPSVSPAALARTGFFYLGDMDRTQCFSCGGVLRNWTLEDDAMAEHRSHFPNCKMILGTEQRNYKVNEFPDPPADRARDYPCRFPSNPHMRNEVARQDTFDRRWPVGRTAATPAEISQAGFFFLGERDRVKCWYCNGGLQNWEYDDMPWIEHAKWFPTCQFLLQVKGQHFVYRHLTMNPHLARPIIAKQDGATVDPTGGTAGGAGGSSQGNVDIPPGGPVDRQPEPTPEIIDPQVEMRKRKERVKTTMEKSDLVKSILLMGFDEKIVAALLEDKIESGNVENPDDIYDSMSSLLDDVMKKENELKEEESQMQAAVQIPAVMNVGGATSMAFQSYNSAYSSMSTPMSSLGPSPGSGKYQVSLIDDNEEPMDEDMYGSVEAGPSTTEVTPAKQLLNAEENSESLQQQLEKIEEERMCKICFSNPADMVFIPCSHMICCMECTQAIRHCPVCRKKIEKAIKTYAN